MTSLELPARYLLTHLDHVTNPIQAIQLHTLHMVRSDMFDTNITADLEMWYCMCQAVLDRLECQLLCKQTAGQRAI